jgi:hypothetical protein
MLRPPGKGYKGAVRVTRILLAGALGASALVLAACGSVRQELDPVASAATKTAQSGGVKLTMSLDASGGGKSFSLVGNGVFDDQHGTMTMTVPSLGQATVDYLTENGDAVVYLTMPSLSGQLPGGKKWIRLDVEKAAQAAGLSLSAGSPSALQNPADALKLLEQSGTFTTVGTETIDGVSTTHYHVTIDLQKAAAAAGASDAVKQLLQQGAPTDFPVDVWIDDSGYLRQVKESYSGAKASTDITLQLSDYGTSVDVTAPPADEVFDATALASQFGSAASGTTTHP